MKKLNIMFIVQTQKKTKFDISICPIVRAFTCHLNIDDNNFNLNEYNYNIWFDLMQNANDLQRQIYTTKYCFLFF